MLRASTLRPFRATTARLNARVSMPSRHEIRDMMVVMGLPAIPLQQLQGAMDRKTLEQYKEDTKTGAWLYRGNSGKLTERTLRLQAQHQLFRMKQAEARKARRARTSHPLVAAKPTRKTDASHAPSKERRFKTKAVMSSSSTKKVAKQSTATTVATKSVKRSAKSAKIAAKPERGATQPKAAATTPAPEATQEKQAAIELPAPSKVPSDVATVTTPKAEQGEVPAVIAATPLPKTPMPKKKGAKASNKDVKTKAVVSQSPTFDEFRTAALADPRIQAVEPEIRDRVVEMLWKKQQMKSEAPSA